MTHDMHPPPPSVQRHPEWAAGFHALLETFEHLPFVWGIHDCATAVADAVYVMTCRDVLKELRGQRRSAFAAARQERRGGGIPAAMARAGLPRVPVAQARRGDVLLLRQGRQRVLALCTGDMAVAPGAQGLQRAPLTEAVMAWRV